MNNCANNIKTWCKNKNNIKNIIVIFLSCMGLFGILYVNKIVNGVEYKNYNGSIVITILFLICYAYKNIAKNITFDKNIIFSVLFSLIVSSITIIGTQLEYLNKIVFELKTIISIICLAIDLFILIYILIKQLNNISLSCSNINKLKISIIGYIVILIMNVLVFLATYPGIFGYDAIYQLQGGLGFSKVTEHYSILYTYMLSGTFALGKAIFGNYEFGCAIQISIQIIFLTYVANKVCIEVYKITRNLKLWIFSLLFFSAYIFYNIMVVSIAQDTMFAAFFVLLFLRIMNLAIEPENKKVHNVIFMFVEVLGICLFRNNGFYAILLIVPFIYFIDKNKKNKIILLSAIIIPMILYKCITAIVYPSIGIVKSTDALKEMSSVPSQQLGRVLLKNPSAYSTQDLEELKKYYNNIDRLKHACIFNPSIADQQKNELNQEHVNENKIGYVKLWTKIGIKDTKNYIEAFLYNNLGLWYPNKNYPDRRMYHPLIEYENTDTVEYNKLHNTNYEVSITRESKIPFYDKVLYKLIKNDKWKKLPVISTVYTIGFCFILVLFTIGIIIMRKEFRLLIPVSLVISYYFTIFMGPVSLFRYVFPITMLIPIYIMILVKNFNSIKSNDNKI